MSDIVMEPDQTPVGAGWARFRRHRPAIASLVFLTLVIGFVVVFPLVSSTHPDRITEHSFKAPGPGHWLGTDANGRDLLARLVAGARVSLLVGVVGTLVSLVVGVGWGAIAGYVGGRWDNAMMRVVDVLYTLPSIIFVIVLITTLEGFFQAFLQRIDPSLAGQARMLFLFAGLGAVSWLTMARVIRGQVLSLRTRPFVEAARSIGAGHLHILLRHILPNLSGLIITYLALTLPAVILYESFLSYLGLGIQAPQASLGTLLAEGSRQINPVRIYWWLLVFPATFFTATLLACNFVGDGLKKVFEAGE